MVDVKELQGFIRSNGFEWPGGYPMILVMTDGGIIDARSARENYRQIREAMRASDRHSGWYPLAIDIHWEGPPEICAHSGREIPSAYGELDNGN